MDVNDFTAAECYKIKCFPVVCYANRETPLPSLIFVKRWVIIFLFIAQLGISNPVDPKQPHPDPQGFSLINLI